MIFRNLDETGDWTFGRGKQNYVDRNEAIGLNIKTRLYSWVGDCFFDQKAGIDWVNRLGSKAQRFLLEMDLRRLILQSEGVTGMTGFDTVLDAATRKFFANYEVQTIYSAKYVDSLTKEL